VTNRKGRAVAEQAIDFYQDEFDSRILERRVYKLWVRQPQADPTRLKELCSGTAVDLIFCFTVFSASNIATMQKLGFALVSIRSTYELAIDPDRNEDESHLTFPSGVVLLRLSEGPPSISLNDLSCLTEVIGATSRYFKDSRIPKNLSFKLYDTWLTNSLYRGYADEVVLAMHGHKLVGIHTLKISGSVGNVDLIGLHPAYQHGGLGRALLQQGIRVFRERKLHTAHVVTEGENVAASRFYQRNGFLLLSTELAWHKHLTQDAR
jgi:GNAT superfamily N-acetyltransferase